MTMSRPAYKITANRPGSDIAAEYAAAFAVSHLVFKERGKWVLLTFMSYWLMIRIIQATMQYPSFPKTFTNQFFLSWQMQSLLTNYWLIPSSCMTSLSTTKQGTLTVSAKQLDITGKTTIHSGDSDRSGPVFIPDNITVLIMVMVNRVIYVGQGK